MPTPEITQQIGADELGRLLEITGQTARVTLEIPAVDLDVILGAERAPVVDLLELVRDELDGCGSAEIYDSPLAWAEPSSAWSIRFTAPTEAISPARRVAK